MVATHPDSLKDNALMTMIYFRGQTMKITKLKLESGNRMLRIGFGQHDQKLFFRVDLWFVGYRLT